MIFAHGAFFQRTRSRHHNCALLRVGRSVIIGGNDRRGSSITLYTFQKTAGLLELPFKKFPYDDHR
jgi:hypothetical protein